MKIKSQFLRLTLLVAFVSFLAVVGNAAAADEWFVLGEQSVESANPSVEITSDAGRWEKDVKQVRISVEGADVQITSVVLHWDNRPDDTLTDVGLVAAGGQTAPANAPGLKARLKSATISYRIQGGATTATIKVWGYD